MKSQQHDSVRRRTAERQPEKVRTGNPPGLILGMQRAVGNAAVVDVIGTGSHAPTGPFAPRAAGTGVGSPVVQRDSTRAEQLTALKGAVAQGDWQQVATRLNGFNEGDIRQFAAGLSLGQAANTRAAVTTHLAGWPQQKMVLDALDQGGSEVTRIGELYARYQASAARSDWTEAAASLRIMTKDDITVRVAALSVDQRESLKRAAADMPLVAGVIDDFALMSKGTTYADVRDDLAYIDNFVSASYDVFRRELHLIFEDGHESAVPMSQLLQGPPTIGPKTQATITRLQGTGDLTLPTSKSGNGPPGSTTAITVNGPDVFFDDPVTGAIRPQNLRATVAPRLFQALVDLDVSTQDLLFQAASAFLSGGPPMPEGSEYLVLLPIFARAGMGTRQALVRAAERQALSKEEQAIVGQVFKGGKAPYASSLGEVEEAAVIAKYAPQAKQLPPKAAGVDWYEGGAEVVTARKEKLKGKPITVLETAVTGGTWTQLHTVLEAANATAANVARAVTTKLDKFFKVIHNPSSARPARDPNPIGPDTYRRVVLDKPDGLVVHIHLRNTKVTPELQSAAQKAYDTYASKGDLPPVRVIVTD